MTRKVTLAVLGILILAYLYPHLSISWHASAAPATKNLPGISAAQNKVWVCPMHPEIMQDHLGTCPICGMELVESKNSAARDMGVHVDSATIQRLGARLAKIEKTSITQQIQTFGNVAVDESSLYNVHSNFDGWIKKSYIQSVGQHVEKGQVIYEVYSPDLVMQQKAYLTFLARRNQILQSVGDVRLEENEYVMDMLHELSRERIKFLQQNISRESIAQFEDSKQAIDIVKIVAAESGVVTQINAREGSFVTPAATLFTLDNVAKVWVTAALYPDQAGPVKVGDEVDITTHDGQVYKSRIEFISPLADNNRVGARAAISGAHLRPGSFVDVTIHALPHQGLTVPSSAVLRTGQGNLVMLHRGDGHFIPAYVDLGVENGESIEITDGLQMGAEIAVNGQFLLDSAASIGAAAQRMQSHHHDGMSDAHHQDGMSDAHHHDGMSDAR